MHDLGLDPDVVRRVLEWTQEPRHVVVKVTEGFAAELGASLAIAFRRCYITDEMITQRQAATATSRREIVAVKLPDRGAVMAGDFGEILTSLIQATENHQGELLDPRKWRLKNDRTKAAPRSDVVQFVLPDWPVVSAHDRVICSEVKTKSTASNHSPIIDAIADSEKDSDGRLVKTLVWLRERAIDTGLESVSVGQLNRFIQAIDHPPAEREFRAVAVVCSELIQAELEGVEIPEIEGRSLALIVVPDLKKSYESVFDAIISNTIEDTDLE